MTYHRMRHPRPDKETSLHQERKRWKRIYPTRIDQQNNHDRIKELLRHNRLNATVSKSIWEAKENTFCS